MANYDASVRVNTKVENSDLKKLQKEFDALDEKLNKCYEKGEKLEALGVDKQSKQWKALVYDTAQYEAKLEDVKDRIQEVNGLKPDKAENGFKAIEKSSKKCFKSIQSGTKKSNGLLATMGSRLKGIALSLLVFNWITKGFNAMVSAMKEGFQNLAQYSDEYNDSMSALKSQSAQLKNGLAAAFEPVVNMVIPYLIQMVSWLNTAADAIGQFFSALQGKSTYTKAKKQMIDYAKSLDAASKSAQGALASFDSLNVLDKAEDKSAAGGVATGEDAFETKNIDNGIVELSHKVEKFLKVIKPYADKFGEGFVGFFKELSNVLSPEFVSLFTELITSLSGGNPENAKQWGEAIAAILTALLGLKGIEKVSTFLGKAWDALVKTKDFFSTLIPQISMLLLSSPGMIGELGITLERLLKGTFLDTSTWTGLPKQINDTILSGIDTVCESIGIFFAEVGTRLLNFDEAGTWFRAAGEWFSRISEDFAKQDWLGIGRDIIAGIGNGLIGALTGLVEPITDLFKWTYEEICKLFGISSPAKEMYPIGKNILLGIVEGFSGEIVEFNKAISDWFDNSVRPWFTRERWKSAMSGVKEAFSNTFKGAVNAAIDRLNEFINCINEKLKFEWGAFNFAGVEVWPSGGFSLAQIPNIPRLADGAVIQGGRPFAAILGDQRFGQTNIETPLSTMVDAFKQAISDTGISRGYSGPIYLQLDGRTFAKLELPYLQSEERRIGATLKVT